MLKARLGRRSYTSVGQHIERTSRAGGGGRGNSSAAFGPYKSDQAKQNDRCDSRGDQRPHAGGRGSPREREKENADRNTRQHRQKYAGRRSAVLPVRRRSRSLPADQSDCDQRERDANNGKRPRRSPKAKRKAPNDRGNTAVVGRDNSHRANRKRPYKTRPRCRR